MTYDALVAALKSYGVRQDAAFINQIPTFIMLAENRLATTMKQDGFQAVVTGTLALSRIQVKPAFWRETISFDYTVGTTRYPLRLRSLEYVKQFWPDITVQGAPRYYADYNINNFYVAGTPDMAYPFELVYYARLDPLATDHQENWMSLNAPQALLSAAMLEASLWTKNDAEIQKWMGQYQMAFQGLMEENKRRLGDRNEVVS